jgi:predicted ATPase/DNA-binding SARP family transcriptional activator
VVVAGEGLRILVLGEVRALRYGVEVALGGPRRAAVLAVLLLRAPRAVGRAELVDALWGEDPPESAVNAIQVHVSALRRLLGRDALVRAGDGYRLSAESSSDLQDFVDLSARGTEQLGRGEADAAAGTLRSALELWRGPPLGGVDAAFVAAEAERLEALRLTTLTLRIEADLAVGRHRDVVPELHALVGLHPFHEGLLELLMRALYRCDRQAEALAVYDAGRRMLRDELGLEPSAALQDLHRRILTHSEPGAAAPAAAGQRWVTLPALLDATFGRERELQALEQLVVRDETRLTTVLGPGGVGKTRLAIELGRRTVDRFRDGVALVSLADAEKAAEVAPAISSALGLQASDDAADVLATALRGRHMLLVCDNFEHVTDAATLLSTLLAAAPELHVLITSRQSLGVRGERRFVVEPLEVSSRGDGRSSAAAELFLNRARAMNAGLVVGPDEWSLVEQICTVCEGLPLAIELAAARTRALGLAELHERLRRSSSVLDGGPADLPERQRAVWASIAWSVGALPTSARQFLSEVAVFRGGFTLAAAAAVTDRRQDETLEMVELLLDHSLLRRSQSRGGRHRFVLLEMIRQYAVELLSPTDLARANRRLAEFLLAGLHPVPDPSGRPATASDWTSLLPERANIRAAVEWALDGPDGELAAELVIGSRGMWDRLGPRAELARWLDAVLARPDIPAGRRIDAAYGRARHLEYQGDLAEMGRAIDAARELAEQFDDTRRQAWIEAISAWHAAVAGDTAAAEQRTARAEQLARAHPDAVQLTVSIRTAQAQVAMQKGNLSSAIQRLENALDLAGATQHDVATLALLTNLAEFAFLAGQPARAKGLADHGMETAVKLAAPDDVANFQSQRGYASLLLGNPGAAHDTLAAALGAHIRQASTVYALEDLLRLAAVYSADQPAQAAHLLGVFDAAWNFGEDRAHQQLRNRHLTDLPARLGEKYEANYRAGQELVADRGAVGALIVIADHLAAAERVPLGQS